MLAVAEEHIKAFNPEATVVLAGQELNDESYAICKSDMVIKGYDVDAIAKGDTLADDKHAGKSFDYCLSNPPYGVEWKRSEKAVRREADDLKMNGRFGPGLPSISDGQLLFLLHLISKMRPIKSGGGRVGIVLNGSSLFTGAAGSGESEIRRHIIESDLLEAIVALPTDMFYNTGISTYIWILDNDKSPERRGKVQLIDGSNFFSKMRKSLGSKRKQISAKDIDQIVGLYDQFEESGTSKIFNNADFGYHTVTVERPLQLNFQTSRERVEAVFAAKPVPKLSEADQALLRESLDSIDAETVWKNRDEFTSVMKTALKKFDLKLAASPMKAALGAWNQT